MKKVLSLTLALLLVLALAVSFAGCGNSGANVTATPEEAETAADPAAELVGSWAYSDSYIYTFEADGTGQYDAGGTIMPLTYEVNDGVLAITFEGNTAPMELEYSIEGDVLTIIDSLGDEVIYNKQ